MPRKNAIIFSVIYLIINSVIFYLSFNNYLSTSWSFNIVLSVFFTGILGMKINLFTSLIYLVLSTIVFCGLADSAKRNYQMVIVLIVAIGITLPILNANGI